MLYGDHRRRLSVPADREVAVLLVAFNAAHKRAWHRGCKDTQATASHTAFAIFIEKTTDDDKFELIRPAWSSIFGQISGFAPAG